MGDNGKEHGNHYSILGFIWGIMEQKMETTIVYWGLYGDNGKENGNHYSILWFIWGIMEKKMETTVVAGEGPNFQKLGRALVGNWQ